jgi:hypothetical protein
MVKPARPSLRSSARRRWRSPTARWPCRCHPPLPPTARELAYQRQARRLALQPPRWAFPQQGWPGWARAQPLGSGKPTVCRDRQTETLPERQRRTDRGRRLLAPSTPDRLERWNAGGCDAGRRVQALQPRGDTGSDGTVAR